MTAPVQPPALPPAVTVRAAAKVNLVLVVGPARPDGFHPLDTVYQAISLYDDVRVTEADAWSVSVTPIGDVDCSGVPLDEANIALRAGRLLTAHHGTAGAAHVEIHKGIPVAGGLAGGSADAAATLVALDRLWDLGTTDDDLLALAAELGSDVPFALLGGSAHGLGRGELVEPVVDEGSYWWVVVPSEQGLSTPAVYAELDRLAETSADSASSDHGSPDHGSSGHGSPGHGSSGHGSSGHGSAAMVAALERGDATAVAASLRNDLEAPAFSLRPELARRVELVAAHTGGPVLLSGSGPTLVAASADQDTAREARAALLEAGLDVVHVATGPVAGAHVVEYV